MEPETFKRLEAAAGNDPAQLARWKKRSELGEPIAYILGAIEFRGRRYGMDRRAFITDPELTHLLDEVIDAADNFRGADRRPARVAEFGVGGGILSIALKLERPNLEITGVELDSGALCLARENAARHGASIELIESDFFKSWPSDRPAPDIIFADPPWGDAEDLYDAERDENHYLQMPPLSAFPSDGGRTGLHRALIAAIADMQWSPTVYLNLGILPDDEVAALSSCADPHGTVCLIERGSIRILQIVYHSRAF